MELVVKKTQTKDQSILDAKPGTQRVTSVLNVLLDISLMETDALQSQINAVSGK